MNQQMLACSIVPSTVFDFEAMRQWPLIEQEFEKVAAFISLIHIESDVRSKMKCDAMGGGSESGR